MHLWNRQWTRKELMERVGTLSQLGGITHMEYADGKAKGVSVLHVRTAAGLEFDVLPDRGMDIVGASYKGKSLAWHSPVGITHPAYYDARDIQWVKTFPAGCSPPAACTRRDFPARTMARIWDFTVLSPALLRSTSPGTKNGKAMSVPSP